MSAVVVKRPHEVHRTQVTCEVEFAISVDFFFSYNLFCIVLDYASLMTIDDYASLYILLTFARMRCFKLHPMRACEKGRLRWPS